MKKETQIKTFGITTFLISFVYLTAYIKDNEYHSYPEVPIKQALFFNGEILLPDYVNVDTLVVINAALLNEQIPLTDTDESISDLLGEGCVNIADYEDYMNVVKQ